MKLEFFYVVLFRVLRLLALFFFAGSAKQCEKRIKNIMSKKITAQLSSEKIQVQTGANAAQSTLDKGLID